MHPQMGDKSSTPFQNLGGKEILGLEKSFSPPKKNWGRSKVVQKTKSLPCFLIGVLWDCHMQVKRFPCFLTGKQFF